MADATQPAEAKPAAPATDHKRGGRWRLAMDGLLAVAMVAASFVGLAATELHAGFTELFWYAVAAGFGLAAVLMTWIHGSYGRSQTRATAGQLIHWVAVGAALWVLFYFVKTEHFADADAGLTCGILIGLGAFLAGVHGQWRMGPIGLALVAATALVALIEDNLLMLIGLGVGAVLLVLLISRIASGMAKPAAA